MNNCEINRLPVIGDQGLVGILSRADVVKGIHRVLS
jgi:CBS domain-containing protein